MRTTLYRPVGLKEMELIANSGFKKFPPRIHWQPIFYPVMNQEYAEQIAFQWNTTDEFSGFCGIVTSFDVDSDYLQKFEIQNVGTKIHNELWVPAEELDEFNNKILDTINVVKVFFGDKYKKSEIKELNIILEKFK